MRYENEAFRDAELHLDGNEYINCTFENCTLIYSASGVGGRIEPLPAKGLTIEYREAAKIAVDLHDHVLIAGIGSNSPMGAYLRVGSTWFQRVDKPGRAGPEGDKTEGLAVVII